MKSNLVDLSLLWVRSTDKAYGVKETEDSTLLWLPKSQVEVEGDEGKAAVFTMPEWLAQEKELI